MREKAQANLAAIRTLKQLDADNRAATPEEKGVLVKYAGWGAMPGAFEPRGSREWRSVADELSRLLTLEE